jgi:hypothetical protein
VTLPSQFAVGGVTVGLVSADLLAAGGAGDGLAQVLALGLVAATQSGLVNFEGDDPHHEVHTLAVIALPRECPQETTALVAFLASPQAGNLTGADYLADGSMIKTV